MDRQKRSWLTRRDKVELFEQIRRELEFGVGTIAGVSRKLGVHRRMVREALRSAEPAASKPQRRRLRKLVDGPELTATSGPRLLAKLNRSQIWKCPFMPVQSPCRSRDLEEAVADANVLIERHRNAHGHSHHE